ncbi:MAG: zinc ribbon domain-containing protein [Ruminiclostridium sp.]|nr:zinc ribbon domain-containing protein [Ruminiclostridium sp.]
MFCRNCGIEIPVQAGFCSGCGAKVGESPQTVSPEPTPTSLAPRKRKLIDLLMIPVAVILILLGAGQLALEVVGSSVNAQVTGYEQVLIVNNDDSTRNPSRYKLEYQFSVNGQRYTGSVTRVFTGGTHMRKTIPVRYLPFWPHVNAEDGETGSFAGFIMLGAGIVLLVFGIRKKPRLQKTN